VPANVRAARWWGIIGAVVALATTIAVAQTPPMFQARVDVVVVEATVLDRDGAVVTDLKPADFAVEIEGTRREVVSAEFVRHDDAGGQSMAATADITSNTAAAAGRSIVIAVDYVSLRAQSRDVLQTAKAWVGTLGPTDRVGLIALPQPGVNVEPTTDHARVVQALDTIVAHPNPPPPFSQRNISPWEVVRMWEGDEFVSAEVLKRECKGGDPSCPDEIKTQVKSRQLDMQSTVIPVVRALRSLAQGLRALPGPKHVVLLTSGWLMSEREAALEMATVAGDAALANVTIHTFTTEQWALAASRSQPQLTPMQDAMLLMATVETLSGMTGGRAVRLAGKADLAFASLSAGLAGYYRLGIRAQSEDLDGRPRRISTKVLRSGLTLANNRRILAATPSPTAKAPASGDPQAALRAALESPTPELGLDVRATAYVLHAAAGSRDVRVVMVGDVERAAAGTATAVAALYDADGRPVTAMENKVDVAAGAPAPVSIELPVPQGRYTLRLAVRDAEGHVGSLERPVDARWQTIGGVETPGLVLFRAPLGASAPSGLLFESVTTADQVIAQLALGAGTDRATPILFEVTRPGSDVLLARRAGRIAETTTGALVARDALPAVTLGPGRYTMTARIGGTGSIARSFSVTAAPTPIATPAPSTTSVEGSPAPAPVPAPTPAAPTTATAPGLPVATTVRFSASTVLAAGVVAPLIDRLAARPDAAAVRDGISRAKAGTWPTDAANGPLAPSRLAASFVAGLGHLQAGAIDDAARSFRAALQAAPDFTPALIYLGACYAAAGRDQQAASVWQMALLQDPASPVLRHLAIGAWLRADAREGVALVAAQTQPDPPTLLLALTALHDADRRKAPIWDPARDLETMRRLRDAYAAARGESLALVDGWLKERADTASR